MEPFTPNNLRKAIEHNRPPQQQQQQQQQQQHQYSHHHQSSNSKAAAASAMPTGGGSGDSESYISAESALEASVDQPPNTGYISFPEPEAARKETPRDVLTVKSESRKKAVVQGCYIAVMAVMGAFLRMILAQLFGEHCANPGTIGWLASAAPLCVTANGDTGLVGGIVFADLPSNILGSFLMGFFQDGTVLDLAIPMAIAWLSPTHPFQHMTVLHKAFTTGFCGSLTTFSSWNSEMVVMMFGTGSNLPTQFWSAMLGYVIGMETAVGSFACGKSVARRLHRLACPALAAEADAMQERKAQGVYLNHELPDFERRFLPNLKMDYGDGSNGHTGFYKHVLPIDSINYLEKWRTSTESVRRVGHPLLTTLLEVEKAVLILNRPIPSEAESIARKQGWNVDAVKAWVHEKERHNLTQLPPQLPSRHVGGVFFCEESKWFSFPTASLLIGVIMSILLVTLLLLRGDHAHIITYRFMVFAMLFAPAGALLRWELSMFNKDHCHIHDWQWFPLGTYMANCLGSMVSIAAVAIELHYEVTSFWGAGIIRAVKVGFAGSLTTVSTFVAEISRFMQTGTDHGYPYILVTLLTASTTSAALYAVIVYLV